MHAARTTDETTSEAALQYAREVTAARTRAAGERSRADVVSAAVLGGSFTAVALAGLGHCLDSWHPGTAGLWIALVLLYAAASRTEFQGVTGSAVPTEPVLVAMLAVGPIRSVPAAVLLGLILGSGWGHWRRGWLLRTAVVAISGWHSLGPVVVLWWAGAAVTDLQRWPILVLALAAQFLFDHAAASVRCVSLGGQVRTLRSMLVWTFLIDAVLAPIGLSAAIAGGHSVATPIFVAAPVLLVALIERDRRQHLSRAVAIGRAYDVAEHEARVDALTGLSNRRAWEEAITAVQGRLAEGHVASAVVVVADLDHLKVVNDTLGHEAGDEMIQAAAAALRAAAGPRDVVARLGGDEFGILATVQASATGTTGSGLLASGAGRSPEALLEAIRTEVARTAPVRGRAVSISLGAAQCHRGQPLSDAIRRADLAAQDDKAVRRASRPAIVLRQSGATSSAA